MLQLEHVRKRYADFQLQCSLTVNSGRITALIGANGAGKSTLFKAALGLIARCSGRGSISRMKDSWNGSVSFWRIPGSALI